MSESENQSGSSGLAWMLLLAMFYVLSIGPEHGLMYRDFISHDVHGMLMATVYRPLLLLTDVSHTMDYGLKLYVTLFYP